MFRLAVHQSLVKIDELQDSLLGADIQTMLQFMWHLDIVGVAHFVLDCFEYMHGDGTTGTSTSNQLCAAG